MTKRDIRKAQHYTKVVELKHPPRKLYYGFSYNLKPVYQGVYDLKGRGDDFGQTFFSSDFYVNNALKSHF